MAMLVLWNNWCHSLYINFYSSSSPRVFPIIWGRRNRTSVCEIIVCRYALVMQHTCRESMCLSVGTHFDISLHNNALGVNFFWYLPIGSFSRVIKNIKRCPKNGNKSVDAQKTEISISADGDFGEMKKTETFGRLSGMAQGWVRMRCGGNRRTVWPEEAC